MQVRIAIEELRDHWLTPFYDAQAGSGRGIYETTSQGGACRPCPPWAVLRG